MLGCYSRTWGGDGNGLVACSSSFEVHEYFWPLLTAFDPDQWSIFQRTLRGIKLADPEKYAAMIDADVRRFSESLGRDEDQVRSELEHDTRLDSPLWGRAPTAIQERIKRWYAPRAFGNPVTSGFHADAPPPSGLVNMSDLTHRPDRVHSIDTKLLPPEIRVMLAARVGAVSPGFKDALEARGTSVEELEVTDADLADLIEFAWTGSVDVSLRNVMRAVGERPEEVPPDPAFANSAWVKRTPLAQSRLGCDWFTLLRPGLEEEPVIVVCGNTANDFTYAFTRQRMARSTYWFPDSDDKEVGRVLRDVFTRVIERYARSPTGNAKVQFVSLSLSKQKVEKLIQELRSTTWGAGLTGGDLGQLDFEYRDISTLNSVRDTVLIDKEHAPNVQWEPFMGPDLARSLEVPLPSEAVGVRPESCRWQVDAEITNHRLPARSALNPSLVVESADVWAIRSSRAGISVDSHGRGFMFSGSPLSQMLVQARIRFPEPPEIFRKLLGDDATIEPSDKGLFADRMEALWGGLEPLASDLRDPPTHQLLNAWVSGTVDGDLGRIHQGRKYLRLGDVMRLAGIHIDEARELVDRYLRSGIATRGLVLKCARCKATAFYALSDVGHEFRCIRCRQVNELSQSSWRQTREPQWFYGLDEVAYLGLINNARVPLLALSELAEGTRSFLHMAESRVSAYDKRDLELDLWAIADGRILIGEAKLGDRIESSAAGEKERLASIRDLALQLTADEVVFATATQWRSETRRFADAIVGKALAVRYLEGVGS